MSDDARGQVKHLRRRNRRLRRLNRMLREEVRGPTEGSKFFGSMVLTLAIGAVAGAIGTMIASSLQQRAERDRQLSTILVDNIGTKRAMLKTFGDSFPGAAYRAYMYRHRLAWLNEASEEARLQGLVRNEVRQQYYTVIVPDYLNHPNLMTLCAAARVEFPDIAGLRALQDKCNSLLESTATDQAGGLLGEINRMYSEVYEAMLSSTREYEARTLRRFGYDVDLPAAARPGP